MPRYNYPKKLKEETKKIIQKYTKNNLHKRNDDSGYWYKKRVGRKKYRISVYFPDLNNKYSNKFIVRVDTSEHDNVFYTENIETLDRVLSLIRKQFLWKTKLHKAENKAIKNNDVEAVRAINVALFINSQF
jgi:hypothetical protein